MSLSSIAGLLLVAPLLLVSPAADDGLARSGIKDRDLTKVGKNIVSYFTALGEDDRGAQKDSLDDISGTLGKAAKKAKADAPLTAYLGDWDYLLEQSKPQPREFKGGAGKGFFKHAFVEPYDETSLGVMISLPADYAKGELYPVIVALKPTLGASGAALEKQVAEMGQAIYGELLKTHIVLVPLGPDQGSGRRKESIEIEGGWFTDEGLYAFFTGFRVLLEQVRFDRSRVVLDGWGDAGLDALRIVTTSSFFAGFISRSGGVDAPDVLLENLDGIHVLYVQGAGDGGASPGKLEGMAGGDDSITILSESGSAMTPSAETQGATAEWLSKVQVDLARSELTYKLGDIRFQARNWCKAAVINRRVTAKPADKDFPRFKASVNRDANTIAIESVNVLEMEIYLNDALVDMSAPVTITVNGEVKSKRTPRPSLRMLLDNRYYNNSQDYGLYTDMVLIEGIPANVPGRR